MLVALYQTLCAVNRISEHLQLCVWEVHILLSLNPKWAGGRGLIYYSWWAFYIQFTGHFCRQLSAAWWFLPTFFMTPFWIRPGDKRPLSSFVRGTPPRRRDVGVSGLCASDVVTAIRGFGFFWPHPFAAFLFLCYPKLSFSIYNVNKGRKKIFLQLI